jgi:hypothetical protein
MHYGLRQLVPPVLHPVSLTRAKNQLVIDESNTFDDDLIVGYLSAAREYAERYTSRILVEQTLMMTLDHFPWHTSSQGTSRNYTPAYAELAPLYDSYAVRGMQINLPRSPLVVVVSITYLDDALQSQTIPSDQYIVDTTSEPGRIIPIPGAIWPYQINYVPGSVQVTFIAGYSRNITDTVTVSNNVVALSQPPTTVPSVKNATSGSTLDLVEGTPAEGQFAYADGVVTLNEADNGTVLTLSYRTPNVPFTIQQAILLMVGSWYQTREGVSATNLRNVPLGVDALLSCNRLFLTTIGN